MLRTFNNRSLAAIFLCLYLVLQYLILILVPSSDNQLTGKDWKTAYFKPKSSLATSSALKESFEWNLEVEIERGVEYARSIKNMERKLLFLHIPKTAGTTIEDIGGKEAKIAWGSCLFNHRPKRPGNVCRYPPGQFEWPTKIGYWHLPMQLFPLKGLNPYKNADIFAVVRDPYDRLLSEFYYMCRRKITKHWNFVDCNRTRLQEPKYLNEWLEDKLAQFPTDLRRSEDFLKHNGHFTPQSQFLVSYPSQIRMVDYVLRMDNLAPEFNELMKAYKIDVRMLSHHKTNAARNGTMSDLKVQHLDHTTRTYIQELFADDVDILYDKRLD